MNLDSTSNSPDEAPPVDSPAATTPPEDSDSPPVQDAAQAPVMTPMDGSDNGEEEVKAAEGLHSPDPPAVVARTSPWLRLLDVLVFVALVAVSAAWFYQRAAGDLFSDEADYALASVQSFESNRWDRSDSPKEPEKLVARRHYHAPLTVYLIAIGHRLGAEDRAIRLPFIISGGLSIGVVYLCGLALFDRRREIAVACAIVVAISPAFVRMASHALPWSPIILELLVLLWCMVEFTRSRHWGWIVGLFAALGMLFVTSEMVFVAAPAVLLSLPVLLWPAMRPVEQRRGVLLGAGMGAILFVAIVLIAWPSGFTGESMKMLRHYIQMRHSASFPAVVGQQVFPVAPKWAYAYWYWNDYKPFSACYLLAVPGLIGLALARRLPLGTVPLSIMTGFLLFAAHRAHIIGPEYLAHCLPFLTLGGGLAVYGLSLAWRPLAIIALGVLVIPIARWSPRVPLPGMDARAQISRWPAAARVLGPQWRAGDKLMVGSQPVSVARWYLVYQGGAPPLEAQFQPMPIHAPNADFLARLDSGFYRYVAVSNMFVDSVDLDVKTERALRHWPVVWRSDERGSGPSRLTIYRAPERPPAVAPPSPPLNRP